MNCESCKYWGGPNDSYRWREGVLPDWSRWNQLPEDLKDPYEQHNRDSRRCSRVDEGWMWEGDAADLPLATVWDGSEFAASLHTHKSFGCVLWEEA